MSAQPSKKLTARDVVALLAAKHAEDVFVPECKDGPSQSVGGNHVRLDGWAMKKSWSHPSVIGYEVKVSRGDWLADSKWPSYLPLCNQLYFVSPSNVIKPEEIPAGVGLMYASSTGTMLRTVRKAPFRDVAIPENLWRYILMCRAKIGEETTGRSSIERWRVWLLEREDRRSLGWQVSAKVAQHVAAVERENEQLKKRMDAYDGIRLRMQQLGIEDGDYASAHSVDRRLEELNRLIPPWFDAELGRLIQKAQQVRDGIAREQENLTLKQEAA